jgi:transcriptional regulator GlxA family with amidase domain
MQIPDLQSLASEAGYSQSNFLRMFASQPALRLINNLLDLKLESVKELLATRHWAWPRQRSSVGMRILTGLL